MCTFTVRITEQMLERHFRKTVMSDTERLERSHNWRYPAIPRAESCSYEPPFCLRLPFLLPTFAYAACAATAAMLKRKVRGGNKPLLLVHLVFVVTGQGTRCFQNAT